MRIGFFGKTWHPALALLWVAESVAVLAASRLGCRLASGPTIDFWVSWTQAVVFGGCVIIAMVAMGLFTRRMRDRMAGIVLRITMSVAAGGVLAALLLGIWPRYAYLWQEFVSALVIAWFLLVLVRGVAQRLIDEDIFKRPRAGLRRGRECRTTRAPSPPRRPARFQAHRIRAGRR